MKRLFGTDGIRAVAGESPLDAATVRRFGTALARVLRDGATGANGASRSAEARVVLGRDTRESGPWLRDAVADGLRVEGIEAVDAGVISTPGLAHVLRQGGFGAGVMISASHNPFADNGLKVFAADGVKLSDAVEATIERLILDEGLPDPGASGRTAAADATLVDAYVVHLESLLPVGRFAGRRVLLDCANGAASSLAPAIFAHYGAEVTTIGDRPDGKNINLGCGSLHLDQLAQAVIAGGHDLGLAFDGDADRCLVVDRSGRTVDGDHILYICGRGLQRSGRLRGDAVVATIMSNYWLEDRLRQQGVRLERTQVGDKYVLARMSEGDFALGGEQSGHVIFRDYASTGDGILTGLLFLDTILDEEGGLEGLMDSIEPYPQVLLNVRVGDKPDLRAHGTIGPVVAEIEKKLEGSGRVVLRYSGTEPVARVMIEGKDAGGVRAEAERLAALIEQELGS